MARQGLVVALYLALLCGINVAAEESAKGTPLEPGLTGSGNVKTVQEISLAPAVEVANNDDIDPTG